MAEHFRVTQSDEETIALGRELGAQLRPPIVVLLAGELGAGKTTLAKGIASGAGAAREEEVTSPTFTLVHVYAGPVRVVHVDLYRVTDAHDLATLGLEDIFEEPAILVVEWPEKFTIPTDWPVLRIDLEHVAENARRITVHRAEPQTSSVRH